MRSSSEAKAPAPAAATPTLGLSSFSFADLYRVDRLPALTDAFHAALAAAAPELAARFEAYRKGERGDGPAHGLTDRRSCSCWWRWRASSRPSWPSSFGVEARARAAARAVNGRGRASISSATSWPSGSSEGREGPTYCGRSSGAREAGRASCSARVSSRGAAAADDELAFAEAVRRLTEKGDAEGLELLERFTFARCQCRPSAPSCTTGSRCGCPRPSTPARWWSWCAATRAPRGLRGTSRDRRRRDGFKLTDRARPQARDPRARSTTASTATSARRTPARAGSTRRSKSDRPPRSALQEQPAGHPARRLPARGADQRDARAARRDGDSLGALAMVCIDNPMLPGTGHRICNDCMKACIFQKQEPVNIPQIETGVLTDVLQPALGLRDLRPADALESAQRHAGRTPLALQRQERAGGRAWARPATRWRTTCLNEGFGVVGIDGLKIEPLPADLAGRRAAACRTPIERLRRARAASSTSACSSASAASPSTASPCAGTRTSSTSLHLHAGAPREVPHLRRHPLRRHARPPTRPATLGFDHVALAAGAGKPDPRSA